MENLKKYPHFQQSKEKRNCGAACLCMLLQHYRMKGKLGDITNAVSRLLPIGVLSCRNDLMVQYAISRGLKCAAVAAKDIGTLLPFCQEQGIDAIVLYHKDDNSNLGHFSVVTNIRGNKIFLNDPESAAPSGINVCMQLDDLMAKMICHGDGDEITISNTVILISKADGGKGTPVADNAGSLLMFPNVRDKISFVLNPNDTSGNPWRPIGELPS